MENSSDCILPALFIPVSVFTPVSHFREISAVVDVAAKPPANLVFSRRPAEADRVVIKPLESDTLCMSMPLSVAHYLSAVPFVAKSELLYSLFMQENGIKSVRHRLWVVWPGTLFSLAAALQFCWKEAGFFFISINGSFSCIHPGLLAFLKGFMRIWLYIQWGAPGLCRVVTYSIILRMIRNGRAPWNGTMVVCIRAVCQSTSDERSQQIASWLSKLRSNGEKMLAEKRRMTESRGVMG